MASSWSDVLAAVRVANLLFRSRAAVDSGDHGPILLQEVSVSVPCPEDRQAPPSGVGTSLNPPA